MVEARGGRSRNLNFMQMASNSVLGAVITAWNLRRKNIQVALGTLKRKIFAFWF